MAKFNFAEKVDRDNKLDELTYEDYSVEPTDVMTGDRNRSRYLLYQLKNSIRNADRIDIIVSFLMESGVRLLMKDLQAALDRGVKVRLLTGNYLGITQPSALYLIKDQLGDRVDLRLYNDAKRSFHAKAYIFYRQDGSEMYIGSSNLSRSALTSGIEWNYRFDDKRDKTNFNKFVDTFEDLFHHHSIIIDNERLKEYSKTWRKPVVQRDLERYELVDEDTKAQKLFVPRGAQIEALSALKNCRDEGEDKGLVYAATGVGKTYLAAFDSMNYEKVLFVAHREEILNQAAQSFKNVRHSENYGFFTGKEKVNDKSVIFASVSSLGKAEYLNPDYFPRDYFDYIVIDEFHHAVTGSYRRIMNYFKPKFLLGLTATPFRMDGQDIYALCNYVVPYELSLKDAINKGMLVPFHYYGIYDQTVDYDKIPLINGKYVESELNKSLSVNSRYDLIYKNYMKYRTKRALGFCCSREHAENMAREFSLRGIPSVAVYSDAQGDFSADRQEAIRQLKDGEIRIIFSVDMFNEGLDICAVDMVLFLRPTESQVVFLQQLGRGLRKSKDKEYLNVLDFIGNYEKAGLAPFLLSNQEYDKKRAIQNEQYDYEYPDDCIVDFDMRLVDLFKEMAKKSQNVKEKILMEFQRIKGLLGHVPSRMELFMNMETSIYQYCMQNSKMNPFKNYLQYLHDINELTEEELKIYNSIGREFLAYLETTSFTKSYKIPILLAFWNNGTIKMELTEEDIYQSNQEFYSIGKNGVDLAKDVGSREFRSWNLDKWVSKAKEQPIKALTSSGKAFFVKTPNGLIALDNKLANVIKDEGFADHMKDIIDYRKTEYYRKKYEDNH